MKLILCSLSKPTLKMISFENWNKSLVYNIFLFQRLDLSMSLMKMFIVIIIIGLNTKIFTWILKYGLLFDIILSRYTYKTEQ